MHQATVTETQQPLTLGITVMPVLAHRILDALLVIGLELRLSKVNNNDQAKGGPAGEGTDLRLGVGAELTYEVSWLRQIHPPRWS